MGISNVSSRGKNASKSSNGSKPLSKTPKSGESQNNLTRRYITPEIAAITTPVGEAFDDRYWGSELQCYLVPDLRKKAKSLGLKDRSGNKQELIFKIHQHEENKEEEPASAQCDRCKTVITERCVCGTCEGGSGIKVCKECLDTRFCSCVTTVTTVTYNSTCTSNTSKKEKDRNKDKDKDKDKEYPRKGKDFNFKSWYTLEGESSMLNFDFEVEG